MFAAMVIADGGSIGRYKCVLLITLAHFKGLAVCLGGCEFVQYDLMGFIFCFGFLNFCGWHLANSLVSCFLSAFIAYKLF